MRFGACARWRVRANSEHASGGPLAERLLSSPSGCFPRRAAAFFARRRSHCGPCPAVGGGTGATLSAKGGRREAGRRQRSAADGRGGPVANGPAFECGAEEETRVRRGSLGAARKIECGCRKSQLRSPLSPSVSGFESPARQYARAHTLTHQRTNASTRARRQAGRLRARARAYTLSRRHAHVQAARDRPRFVLTRSPRSNSMPA